MSYIIAGVVLLLSFTVGIVSFITIPLFEKVNNDNSEEKCKTAPAITLSAFFSRKNLKQIIFVLCMALICSAISGFAHHSGTAIFTLVRQITVALVLLAAMIIDFKTRLIPNILVFSSLGIGALILILEFIFIRDNFVFTLIMSAAGLLCCLVLFYLLSRLTKDGIGMGDVKLISVMGFLLGIASVLTSVLFSLIICTLVSTFLLFRKKKKKNDSMPFGPFLFLGYILMFILLSI